MVNDHACVFCTGRADYSLSIKKERFRAEADAMALRRGPALGSLRHLTARESYRPTRLFSRCHAKDPMSTRVCAFLAAAVRGHTARARLRWGISSPTQRFKFPPTNFSATAPLAYLCANGDVPIQACTSHMLGVPLGHVQCSLAQYQRFWFLVTTTRTHGRCQTSTWQKLRS
jgi:hypothetical protein